MQAQGVNSYNVNIKMLQILILRKTGMTCYQKLNTYMYYMTSIRNQVILRYLYKISIR